MIALDLPLPMGAYFDWASRVTEELADYGIAGPTTEDAWKTWAQQLLGIDELDNEVPQPQGFPDWRTWAFRTLQTLG